VSRYRKALEEYAWLEIPATVDELNSRVQYMNFSTKFFSEEVARLQKID
jgi:hypothetical protein